MMADLISIIVPNFNHSQFLSTRLNSIFTQTYGNFEVILLDDCSTDGSRQILSRYKNHPKVSHCVFNEENSGTPFRQWDRGINLAKGEFIWIAESDDCCEETFLEQLLKPHFTDSNLALSFCQSYRMDATGKVTGNWITHTAEDGKNDFEQDFKMEGNLFIENYLIHKNVIPNVSAVLCRARNLKSLLPLYYEPYMEYNADWFYYAQLVCNSKVAFIQEPLNYFRYHDNSVIGKSGRERERSDILKMELAARKKMPEFLEGCKPENIEAIRREFRKGEEQLRRLILLARKKESSYESTAAGKLEKILERLKNLYS